MEYKVDGVKIAVKKDEYNEVGYIARFTFFDGTYIDAFAQTEAEAIGKAFMFAAEHQDMFLGVRLYPVRSIVVADIPADEYDVTKITDRDMENVAFHFSEALSVADDLGLSLDYACEKALRDIKIDTDEEDGLEDESSE